MQRFRNLRWWKKFSRLAFAAYRQTRRVPRSLLPHRQRDLLFANQKCLRRLRSRFRRCCTRARAADRVVSELLITPTVRHRGGLYLRHRAPDQGAILLSAEGSLRRIPTTHVLSQPTPETSRSAPEHNRAAREGQELP